MRPGIIARTTTRVEQNTDESVNELIRESTDRRVHEMESRPIGDILRRLEELEEEWDIERALEANAAAATLAGLLLGRTVHRGLYALPGVVAGFLLLHAVQGWCPPVGPLRRMGFRTPREIERERRGLEKILESRRPD